MYDDIMAIDRIIEIDTAFDRIIAIYDAVDRIIEIDDAVCQIITIDVACSILEDLDELWADNPPNLDDEEETRAYFLAFWALGYAISSSRNSEQHLNMAYEAEQLHALAMLPLARKRIPFESGAKKGRLDKLAKLIVAALTKFPDATAKNLLQEIRRQEEIRREADNLNYRPVIQEIDEDGKIYWHDGRRERQTTFRTFQNRRTKYREKIALGEITVSD